MNEDTKPKLIPPSRASGSVSVIRNLDGPTARAWIAEAVRMGLHWEALEYVGNGRLRSYRFTSHIDRLFDFAQLTAMPPNTTS